jgi:hypothetical protein
MHTEPEFLARMSARQNMVRSRLSSKPSSRYRPVTNSASLLLAVLICCPIESKPSKMVHLSSPGTDCSRLYLPRHEPSAGQWYRKGLSIPAALSGGSKNCLIFSTAISRLSGRSLKVAFRINACHWLCLRRSPVHSVDMKTGIPPGRAVLCRLNVALIARTRISPMKPKNRDRQ